MTALLYVFLGATLIQLYYQLFIFSKLAFYSKRDKQPPSTQVSIVVCARNEFENLQKLLPLLYQQEYPQLEIIIIDDRSTDNTDFFLKEQCQLHSNLKVSTIKHLPDQATGKKYALTMGIKAASHDRILLTDADCRPGKDWIHSMSNGFEKTFTLGYSQYLKRPGFLNRFIRFETLYTGIQYLSYAVAKAPYMGIGRNLSYTKSIFLDKKGFHGYLDMVGGDDDLFVNKWATSQNTQIAVGKKSIVYSEPKRTLKEYFVQKKRHLSVGKKYRFRDKVKLAVLSISHIIFWLSFVAAVFLSPDKYLIIGAFLLRSVALYTVFIRSARTLGDEINWVWLLILDFIYVIHYITTGITALFAKRISWS